MWCHLSVQLADRQAYRRSLHSHSPYTTLPHPLSPSPPPPTCLPCRCEYGDLAGRLGLLPANGRLTVVDTTGDIKLEGATSIVGRSVVIHEPGGPNFECGTIRLREELEGNVWHYRCRLVLGASQMLIKGLGGVFFIFVLFFFLPGAPVTILQSIFVSPIAGRMYMK